MLLEAGAPVHIGVEVDPTDVYKLNDLEQLRFMADYARLGAPTALLDKWRRAGEPKVMGIRHDHLPVPNIYLLSDPDLAQSVLSATSRSTNSAGVCPLDRAGRMISGPNASRDVMTLYPNTLDMITSPTDKRFTDRKRAWLRNMTGHDVEEEVVRKYTAEAIDQLQEAGQTDQALSRVDSIFLKYLASQLWGSELTNEQALSLSHATREMTREYTLRFLTAWQSPKITQRAMYRQSRTNVRGIFEEIMREGYETQWRSDMQGLGFDDAAIINDMWGMSVAVRATGNMMMGTLYELDKLHSTEDRGDYRDAILEGERLYPGAWISPRYASNDVILNSGSAIIPKGSYVAYSSFLNGRSGKLWGNTADEYNPGRYDSDEKRRVAQHNAFGLGRRRCPGEGIVQATAPLILRHIVEAVDIDFIEPLRLNGLGETLAPRTQPLVAVTARS